ncbi:MAG TPA: tetratricopeptide repeat protein [Terriglobia bacterium]|nr:tetratricopeptide repeat protein [Terriglobia bacterium]
MLSCSRFPLQLGLALVLCTIPVRAQAAPSATQSDGQSGASTSNSGTNAQQLFDSASGLIRQSRFAEAARLLQQAVAVSPQSPGIHHYLGYALWKQDKWAAAEVEFKKAHQLDPNNPYTLYFLARIAQSTQRTEEAIRDYEAILALGLAIYDTNQRLGQLYADRGQLEKARGSLEAGLKETPWESALYYQLGRIDQKTGHPAAAREEFASAERLKGASQVAVQHLLALDQAASSHQEDEVARLRTQILAEASADPEILESAGVLLARAGLYDQAREPLERSVQLDPGSFEAHCNLGLALLHLNQDHDAEASLLAASKLRPESVEVNRALAVLYVGQNRNAEAIERLRAANQASPGDAKVLSLLGQQYLQGHFVKEAVAALREAVKLEPSDPNLRFLLIDAYRAADDDQGIQVAQETIRLFPDSGRAYYEAAEELVNAGRFDDAHPYAEQAAQKDPRLVEGWNALADLDAKSGKYDLALKEFEQAQSLDASNVDAARGIAENLIRLKRYDEALSHIRQALNAHPRDAALYFSLMQVYTRTGQRDEAAKIAATYQQLRSEETAAHDAQAPRPYTPADKTANP